MLYYWITTADGRNRDWKSACKARLFMELPIKASAKHKKCAVITEQKISYEYCYGEPNTLCMCLAAFTMDQLGIMMGEYGQPCYYDPQSKGWLTPQNAIKVHLTEVQARAQILIHLLRQKVITAKKDMSRLFASPKLTLLDIS